MKGISVIGAVVGGVIGAIAWAAIIKLANFEIGWLAWGVGLVVGLSAVAMGGKGVQNGLMCAVVALGSIWLGKAVGYKWVFTTEYVKANILKEGVDTGISREDRDAFAALPEDLKTAAAKEFADSVTWGSAFKIPFETPQPVDLAFAFLGVATAFRVGSGKQSSKSATPALADQPQGSQEPSGGTPGA